MTDDEKAKAAMDIGRRFVALFEELNKTNDTRLVLAGLTSALVSIEMVHGATREEILESIGWAIEAVEDRVGRSKP